MQKGAQHTPFLAAIHDWDDEKLNQAEDDVQRMVDSPGWAVLTELLERGYRSIQGQLTYGKTLEQADYARELGKLVGFEFPQAAAEAVLLKAKERAAKAQDAELAEVA